MLITTMEKTRKRKITILNNSNKLWLIWIITILNFQVSLIIMNYKLC